MINEEDNDKDLNFWMDSNSDPGDGEISDDEIEIEKAISPNSKKKA